LDSAGIEFGRAAVDFAHPCLFDVFLGRRVETVDEKLRKLETILLFEFERFLEELVA
jgi:hypothetical protein